MNGAQMHKYLLSNKHKTSREIAKFFGNTRKWHVTRQGSRHPYIYISGWVKEANPRSGEMEWVEQWSAIPQPVNSPPPKDLK